MAKEVLLALLIERREAPDRVFGRDDLFDDLGCGYPHRLYPPLYTRGPFLFFLRAAPTVALDLIIRLVDFTTDRWASSSMAKRDPCPGIALDLKGRMTSWKGDAHVYYWFRAFSHCPYPVSSALMALEKWAYDEIDAGKSVNWAFDRIIESATSIAFAGLLNSIGGKYPKLYQGTLRPFLAVPEFHLWELEYTNQPHDYLMMGWWGEGKFLLKLAREWHNLSHRTRGLDQNAKVLFLSDPEIRDFMSNVRVLWERRLPALEPGRFRDFLENMLAQYDIENYEFRDHPENGPSIWFEPPTELRVKNELAAKENDDRFKLLTFPLRCKRLLDEQHLGTEVAAKTFWEEVQYIATLGHFATEDPEFLRLDNALCAGAAVLVLLFQDWLGSNPDAERWCRERLLATTLTPPPPGQRDTPVSAYDCYWHSFCARALPTLWANDPQDPSLRRCVAQLAVHSHYRTVALLFRAASEHRGQLERHFFQLQQFLILWAVFSDRRRFEQRSRRSTNKTDRSLNRTLKEFVRVSLSGDVPNLLEVRNEPRKSRKTGHADRRTTPRATFGLNVMLVQAAYSWLPRLTDAGSKSECMEWFAFWKQAWDLTLVTLTADATNSDDIEHPQFEWDNWILSNVAACVFDVPSDEQARQLWGPLLALGAAGHGWIDRFFFHWFQMGLTPPTAPTVFVARWRQMIEYALGAPNWKLGAGSQDYRLDEIWRLIMGLGDFQSDLWTEEKHDLVKSMRDLYERWPQYGCYGRLSAIGLARFLRRPATQDLVADGTQWIHGIVTFRKELLPSERGVQDEIAKLLDHVWSGHSASLRQNNSFRTSFLELLSDLVELQHPIAMELHQVVSGSK